MSKLKVGVLYRIIGNLEGFIEDPLECSVPPDMELHRNDLFMILKRPTKIRTDLPLSSYYYIRLSCLYKDMIIEISLHEGEFEKLC